MKPVVNLYTEITQHGPRRQDGAYGWVLEFIRSNGEPDPRTLNGVGVREDTTDRALLLEAVAEGLERIEKECDVTVYLPGDYKGKDSFVAYWENGWVDRWEQEGWVNAKGLPVANAELWKKCKAALQSKNAIFGSFYATNAYKQWILAEINRALQSKINDFEVLENRRPAEKRNFVKIIA